MDRGKAAYYKRLIEEALGGDSNAYAILYVATYQKLYQRAYYYTQSEYLTQDIVTDTYAEAFTTLDQMLSPRSFHAWLRNIEEKHLLLSLRKQDPDKWNSVVALPANTPRMRRKIFGHKAPRMKMDIAGQMLEYLFFEIGKEPNTLPLDSLAEFHEYRLNQLHVQRMALIVVIAFICASPLWFISPNFHISEEVEHGIVTYHVNVSNLIRVKSVVAQIDNQMMPVTQDSRSLFDIKPTTNGEMDVCVTYFNNTARQQKLTVTEVDREAPQVTESHLRSGVVTLVVDDAGSGVDYDNVSIMTLTGERLSITTNITEDQESFSFDYPGGNIDIVIPDMAGNRLHLLLSHD
ncbi:MAG: hypothetical protein IKR14_05685 [Lachnospiraceae bacterium]|nr:hypothetical protein [Lachnospiraceae bacterium]